MLIMDYQSKITMGKYWKEKNVVLSVHKCMLKLFKVESFYFPVSDRN